MPTFLLFDKIMSATISLSAVVIGAGPAGLMAGEQLANQSIDVTIFDAMPSVGRKFLRAGIGGLNLTHSEPKLRFVQRYRPQQWVAPWLDQFDADDLVQWAKGLGVDTFVGTSGRVFPTQKKAAPLLRAWLKRLKESGVTIATRHRWLGWTDEGELRFQTPDGELTVTAKVVIFALGGGSWARLGSDGQWAKSFQQQGIGCAPFKPSNCGFNYPWSDAVKEAHLGSPLKNVALTVAEHHKKGDAVVSRYGLEGSLIYGLSAYIRDEIDAKGEVTVFWDLLPDLTPEAILTKLKKRRAKDSISNVLRKQLNISGAKLALLKELTSKEQMQSLDSLAKHIKQLPQILRSARPLDEAISTGGGVRSDQVSHQLMVRQRPGTFCAGEMLDWEAPTGGYLLTACFASGRVAGLAAAAYFKGLTA